MAVLNYAKEYQQALEQEFPYNLNRVCYGMEPETALFP